MRAGEQLFVLNGFLRFSLKLFLTTSIWVLWAGVSLSSSEPANVQLSPGTIPLGGERTHRLETPYPSEAVAHIKTLDTIAQSSWTTRCDEIPELCVKKSSLKKGFVWQDSQSSDFLQLRPMVGMEYRVLQSWQDTVFATDLGAWLAGRKGNLSFWLDGRIYSETHERESHWSWDGEFLEVQDSEDGNAEVTYVSFARYRASLQYDGVFGTLGFRRDALSWGPGYSENLVFNQSAVPFNQYYYQAALGPVRIMSLWGALSIDSGSVINGGSTWNRNYRHVYAHRYEWDIMRDLTLGVSEQMIVYNDAVPAALIPVVPLFMEKGQVVEPNNNGNIALDLSWRFPGLMRVYTEFLVDDLQDPAGLFNDFWGNRWAWMSGFHLVHDFAGLQGGLITEFSRIEPWVYTHYKTQTAQSLNRERPLGNPNGPNSQNLMMQWYLRRPGNWRTGLRFAWLEKGIGPGSSASDAIREYDPETKEFLGNAHTVLSIEPQVAYTWKWFTIDARAQINTDDETNWAIRLHSQY